ncbi:MAG: hypothetical protein JXR88_18850 [Clostridia bacterium]|nr:hypothetical protein [Clostridia bacterium]
MTLSELLHQIRKDHEDLMTKKMLKVKNCFKSYAFEYYDHIYYVQFNLLTLDFKAENRMPVPLRSKIRFRIMKAEYLKWKFKKEGRAFFDFLKLYYDTPGELMFTDCESPDFIIHYHGEHGYEVTEATDAHNAKFNEAVYYLTNSDHHSKEFQVYVDHIQNRLKATKITPTLVRGKQQTDIMIVNEYILKCIVKKAKKYEQYESNLSTHNIIVFNNRIGFRRQDDFNAIGEKIKSEPIISSSIIDKIFVISGNHNLLVVYDKYGSILDIIRNSYPSEYN